MTSSLHLTGTDRQNSTWTVSSVKMTEGIRQKVPPDRVKPRHSKTSDRSREIHCKAEIEIFWVTTPILETTLVNFPMWMFCLKANERVHWSRKTHNPFPSFLQPSLSRSIFIMKSVLSGINAVKYNKYKQEAPGTDHLLSSSLHPAYPSSPCSGPGRQAEPGHVWLSGKYKQDVLLILNSNQHLNTPHAPAIRPYWLLRAGRDHNWYFLSGCSRAQSRVWACLFRALRY